ncbi:hypothetical protein ACHAXR_011100 [Thalassiosira sp. AJA248-18]
MKPTDRRHSRHTSEGSSFSYGSANAAANTANNNTSSPAIPMTRLDHNQPPPTHPNRLIPAPSPTTSSSGNNNSPTKKSPFQRSPPSSQDPSPLSSRRPSPSSSIPSSPAIAAANDLNNIHLTRISSPSHLSSLPPEFLTNDPDRPLLHVDEGGHEYHYFLNPMKKAVFFILLVEMLERFSFYGINYTTTAYLTGEYNDDWNADMPSILASSYVSISTAVAYTTPFLGATLADNILGEYLTIFLGSVLCYIPGLLLIAMTTIPQFLGQEFNHSAIRLGLLVLWPIGTGTVKACVNVFGAKQFHPILQSSLIESYYVNFYTCINIGALTGGTVVPIIAQWSVTVAYFIPVCMLALGVTLFAAGTKRYVRPKPKHDASYFVHEALAFCGCDKSRRSKRDRSMVIQPSPTESKVGIGTIMMLSSLVVPFNVAYAQMATTFIVQGSVMENFGVVDAPMMNNADAVSVLALGYIIGNVMYPALHRRGIKIPTTHKFAIGSALGSVAVLCAIATDYRIHRVYRETGEAITVLWQVFPYFLIGIGEIFAVSAAYELAFTVAPAKMKAVASAANLFMVGGLPNVFCIGLYNICRAWFLNSRGEAHIHKLEDYVTASVVNYFWLLEGITLLGVIVNLSPWVKNWVASIEESAAETVKSPMSTPNIRKNLIKRRQVRKQDSSSGGDEETPLIRSQKHANYLKYGNGPELMKMGSMRAGPSLKKKAGGGGGGPHSHNRPPTAPGAQNTSLLQVRNKLLPHAEDGP